MKLYVVHHHMYHAPSEIRGIYDDEKNAFEHIDKIKKQLKEDFNDDGFNVFLEEIELNTGIK